VPEGRATAGEITHGVPTLGELAEADEAEDAAAEADMDPPASAASKGAGHHLRRTGAAPAASQMPAGSCSKCAQSGTTP